MVNKNFSPEEKGGTVWVTDRWPAYFMGDVGMEDHQICIAHLLRDLTYTAQAFRMTPGAWTGLTSCGTPSTIGIRETSGRM